jgi:hypothetical protein
MAKTKSRDRNKRKTTNKKNRGRNKRKMAKTKN